MRKDWFTRPSSPYEQKLYVRWSIAFGIVGMAVLTWILTEMHLKPPEWLGWVEVIVLTVTLTLLAIAIRIRAERLGK